MGNKRRGYDGEKVLDLLRVIRNKVYNSLLFISIRIWIKTNTGAEKSLPRYDQGGTRGAWSIAR